MKYFNLEANTCDFNKEFLNPWSRDLLCDGAPSESSAHVLHMYVHAHTRTRAHIHSN